MAALKRTGATSVIEVKSFEGVEKSIRALDRIGMG
jgi:hypothetical protein